MNWNQNNYAKLLLIAKFANKNTKNASIGHIPFKLNRSYNIKVIFKNKTNFCLKSRFAIKLVDKLRELIEIYS